MFFKKAILTIMVLAFSSFGCANCYAANLNTGNLKLDFVTQEPEVKVEEKGKEDSPLGKSNKEDEEDKDKEAKIKKIIFDGKDDE